MLAGVLLAAALVPLQGVGGQIYWINPNLVVSVRQPRGVAEGHWPATTRCLVMMVNGYVTASEPCEDVRRKLQRE